MPAPHLASTSHTLMHAPGSHCLFYRITTDNHRHSSCLHQRSIFTNLSGDHMPLSWRSTQIVTQFLAIGRLGRHNVTKCPVLPVEVEPLEQLYTKLVAWHHIRRWLLLQLGSKHISKQYYTTQSKPAAIPRMDADTTDLLHSQQTNILTSMLLCLVNVSQQLTISWQYASLWY